MAGRPSKLTPEVAERILRSIRAGNYLQVAAEQAEIDKSTLHRWLADDRPMYREFRDAVQKAEADAEARNVAIIETAAAKNWQAAAWYLERKHADRWGQKQRVEIVETMRQEARRVARDLGLDEEEVLAQAEAILARGD